MESGCAAGSPSTSGAIGHRVGGRSAVSRRPLKGHVGLGPGQFLRPLVHTDAIFGAVSYRNTAMQPAGTSGSERVARSDAQKLIGPRFRCCWSTCWVGKSSGASRVKADASFWLVSTWQWTPLRMRDVSTCFGLPVAHHAFLAAISKILHRFSCTAGTGGRVPASSVQGWRMLMDR